MSDELKAGKVVRIGEGVTLILGDCLDVLPTLDGVDAVITDPPYGLGSWGVLRGSVETKECAKRINEWDDKPPTAEMLLTFAKLGTCVMWGGNYLGLPPFRTALIWDKKQRNSTFAECEIAWTNFKFGSTRILEFPIRKSDSWGAKQHPTQKPIRVMEWSLEQARVPLGATVLDPYMGSGTTGIACIRTGRKFIGIERDPVHFATAEQRIRRELEAGTFDFAAQPASVSQQPLL
jgi:DNA modification methylase